MPRRPIRWAEPRYWGNEEHDIAHLLSVADAVVLPFRLGGRDWNTSIHSAVANRACVVTISMTRHGYDAQSNVFCATVGSAQEMRSALAQVPRHRPDARATAPKSSEIAASRLRLYESDRPSRATSA
ncbi:MAG: hypothetical protein WA210_04505 [Burkholderiaceae bacterium]